MSIMFDPEPALYACTSTYGDIKKPKNAQTYFFCSVLIKIAETNQSETGKRTFSLVEGERK